MRSPLRVDGSGIVLGGTQVAEVNMSTILRMKNLGNVPPRLETLLKLVSDFTTDDDVEKL